MHSQIPRAEFPRPDFERSEWINLNGEWEFEFDDENKGEIEGWQYENSKVFSMKILVPFCFQSRKSGINDTGMHEIMWYRRTFDIPEKFKNKKILLNFGAVDYIAKIWVNGKFAGYHKGGYVPFKFEITNLLKKKNNIIVVKVEDYYNTVQPRGKQYWKQKSDRCWYTATSGIWQTVWIEAVGDIYIEKIRMTPDIDRRCVFGELYFNKETSGAELSLDVKYKGRQVSQIKIDIQDKVSKFAFCIKEEDHVDEVHYWTPDAPNLYDVFFKISANGEILDDVKSYFGMRKISIKDGNILLNNRPIYQKLILDQGYWPESLLTPPSEEAIIYDIEMAKRMGFNGVRKHQKIEDPRYYYWADRLGLLVWAEMPSAYDFNVEEIQNIVSEWIEFINRDYNHPCIITWVPLNESWGTRNIFTDKNQQDFGLSLYYITKAFDGTRLISTNDGWENLKTDICTIHDYSAKGNELFRKYGQIEKLGKTGLEIRQLFCQGFEYECQPVMITEYGGIAFENEDIDAWGYNGEVKDENSFFERYSEITKTICSMNHVKGYCYTQLCDVMQEVNGLMTEDRKLKVSLDEIKRINRTAEF